MPSPVTITGEEASAVDEVAETMSRLASDHQAASYANFYLANNAALVPIFGDHKFNQLAMDSLQRSMPARKVITINSREILLRGRNIHCTTQYQPSQKKD